MPCSAADAQEAGDLGLAPPAALTIVGDGEDQALEAHGGLLGSAVRWDTITIRPAAVATLT